MCFSHYCWATLPCYIVKLSWYFTSNHNVPICMIFVVWCMKMLKRILFISWKMANILQSNWCISLDEMVFRLKLYGNAFLREFNLDKIQFREAYTHHHATVFTNSMTFVFWGNIWHCILSCMLLCCSKHVCIYQQNFSPCQADPWTLQPSSVCQYRIKPRTANMSWRTCVVVKQIQSNPIQDKAILKLVASPLSWQVKL